MIRDQGLPPRPRGAQAPRGPDRHRDRPRRRDDQRHLHPHGHDQQRVQDALHRVVRRDGRGRHRAGASTSRSTARRHRARRSTRRCSTTVRGVDGVALATGTVLDERNTKILHAGGRGGQLGGRADVRLRHRHESRRYAQFNPLKLFEGRWPAAADEVVIDVGHRRQAGLRRRRHGRDLDAAAEARVRARRRRAVRQRRQPRERELHRLHDPGRAGASRSRGAVRRDLGRGGGRASPRTSSSRRSSLRCRRDAKVVSATRRGRGAGRRGETSSRRSSATSCSRSRRSRSSSARSSSSTRSRSRSRSGRASSRRCGRSARRGGRCSAP